MSEVVNGWARFTPEEALPTMCGATHLWRIYETGMPCNCGRNALVTLKDGTLWQMAHPIQPDAAHRFGVWSHFIEGECGCHPAEKTGAGRPS